MVSRKLPNLPRNRTAFSRTCGKTPRCHAVGDIGAVVLGVQGRLGGVREGQRREAASTEDIVSHLSCGFAEVWSCMRVGRSGCLHPAMPASVPPWVIPAVPHADAVGATQDENEVTWNAALHTG